MNQLTYILIQRLGKKGLAPIEIPRFIRDVVVNIISFDHRISRQEINRQLHLLGWDMIELDDHTLQLIIASSESEGLMDAEGKKYAGLKTFIDRIHVI